VHPPFPREMTIACHVTSLTISAEGLEPPRCRDCQVELNLHQPDEDRPEHLLGTCARCGEWYLLEFGKNLREAYLFDMPNIRLIRAALAATKKSSRKGASKETPDPD
jgi:hypothetical protein